MSELRFASLTKSFDDVVALQALTLDIETPTLLVLVGPSGCGKTTLLRLIAGLEQPTSGEIYVADRRIDRLDARHRDVAMVFQNYALYPHMTVRENLSFGLKIRRLPRETIRHKVEEVARSLEIGMLLDRRPAQLSGGQRQRVALGRAIVREPRVFLFDEPLSNLDARLRDEMRYLIRRLYERLRTMTVYVTHDQVEAMTIGEQLIVMRDGRVHQVGSPATCYRSPADTFVASFLGSPPMNLLGATYAAAEGAVRFDSGEGFTVSDEVARALNGAGSRKLVIGIRPESLRPDGVVTQGRAVGVTGRVVLEETLGHEVLTHIEVGGREIVARSAGGAGGAERWSADERSLHYFDGESGMRIGVGAG